MTSLLLAVIYLAFISLGLPDAALGSVWPLMSVEFHASVSFAGVISMIIAGCTILSSLQSDRLIRRFGTGPVSFLSVALTAIALFGFSVSGTLWQLCLWAIPYGLGAGSIDTALNNFVALHYKSRHMSWLHCFWGVGATAGPAIIGLCLTQGLRWNAGYRALGLLQVVLAVVLALSLPLWKRMGAAAQAANGSQTRLGLAGVLRLRGAKPLLTAFLCYCALESTTGLWASSYLVLGRGLAPEQAARWASFFYLGITAGRFACGFVSDWIGDRNMVRIGQISALAGAALLLIPAGNGAALAGLLLVGMGCAPIFPSLLHATPDHFSPEYSQAVMGVQMAAAYVGTTFLPPIFGLLAERFGVGLYPFGLLLLIFAMIAMTERGNRIHAVS